MSSPPQKNRSRQKTGSQPGFPSAILEDGTIIESTTETVWYDVENRLSRIRRYTRVTYPDGSVKTAETIQQKHPVSSGEVRGWLEAHGFEIDQMFGDRDGSLYYNESPRAIFWARLV